MIIQIQVTLVINVSRLVLTVCIIITITYGIFISLISPWGLLYNKSFQNGWAQGYPYDINTDRIRRWYTIGFNLHVLIVVCTLTAVLHIRFLRPATYTTYRSHITQYHYGYCKMEYLWGYSAALCKILSNSNTFKSILDGTNWGGGVFFLEGEESGANTPLCHRHCLSGV